MGGILILACAPSWGVVWAALGWGLIFGAIIGEFVNRSRKGK